MIKYYICLRFIRACNVVTRKVGKRIYKTSSKDAIVLWKTTADTDTCQRDAVSYFLPVTSHQQCGNHLLPSSYTNCTVDKTAVSLCCRLLVLLKERSYTLVRIRAFITFLDNFEQRICKTTKKNQTSNINYNYKITKTTTNSSKKLQIP